MNLECCVVRDLLPSYAEGLCSPQTTALMKTHLAGCEECKAALRAMTSEAPAEQASIISARQANAGLKAAARRFKLGVIAKTCAFVFLGVIMVVCAALGANQLRGEGVGFTTICSCLKSRQIGEALYNGDPGRAAGLLAAGGTKSRQEIETALTVLLEQGVTVTGYRLFGFGLEDGLEQGKVMLSLADAGRTTPYSLESVQLTCYFQGGRVYWTQPQEYYWSVPDQADAKNAKDMVRPAWIPTLEPALSTWDPG